MVSLAVQKVFRVKEPHLFISAFVALGLGVKCKKNIAKPYISCIFTEVLQLQVLGKSL